jgi:hypothetical protein
LSGLICVLKCFNWFCFIVSLGLFAPSGGRKQLPLHATTGLVFFSIQDIQRYCCVCSNFKFLLYDYFSFCVAPVFIPLNWQLYRHYIKYRLINLSFNDLCKFARFFFLTRFKIHFLFSSIFSGLGHTHSYTWGPWPLFMIYDAKGSLTVMLSCQKYNIGQYCNKDFLFKILGIRLVKITHLLSLCTKFRL